MNANQQTALTTLAGRALTTAEVTLATNRQDADLAASLSVGRTKKVSTPAGYGTVIDALGLTVGNALLDYINAQTQFKYVIPMLQGGRLDLSLAIVESSLTSIATNNLVAGFTTTEVATLMALCTVSDPIMTEQVSTILNGA